ncbi:MAG: CvpA family protein [Candidatus Omnitrophota bacterium]
MEWFWGLVDHFQKSIASTALRNFATVDWIILVLLFIGMVIGGRKGCSDMIGKLLQICLISLVTLGFYEVDAATFLWFLPVFVAQPVAYLFLAVFLWLAAAWSFNLLGKVFKIEVHGFLKAAGGMVLGVLHMALLLSLTVNFLLFFSIKGLQRAFKPGHSFMGYAITKVAPDLRELVMSPFHKPISRKIADSVKGGG